VLLGNGQRKRRILIFGDVAVPTGFGRIGAAAGKFLVARGYEVAGACIQYDGLLPPRTGVPFFCGALQGKDHGQAITGIAAAYQPDIVLSLQDFPYHEMLRTASGIDWSTTGHVVVTPIDGVPIARQWLTVAKQFDALLTISAFGVQALKDEGVTATLCPPGVDTNEFHRLPDDQRAVLRDHLGIAGDAFVVGVMAMNQGRKDFPAMIEGFHRAFKDVEGARLFLDCEKISPAGWDLPAWVVERIGLNPDKVLYREDALRAGLLSLNERYNLLDVHMVIAHREGYGLPHAEAMATGIPSVAMNYCSGAEVIALHEQRGCLVKGTPGRIGTWGGARDYHVDVDDLATQLRMLYDKPAERAVRGARGLEWATARTWDKACEAVEQAIQRVFIKRQHDIARKHQQPATPQPQQLIPAGVQPPANVFHLHAPIYVQGNGAEQVGTEIAQAVGQQVVLMEQKGQGDD